MRFHFTFWKQSAPVDAKSPFQVFGRLFGGPMQGVEPLPLDKLFARIHEVFSNLEDMNDFTKKVTLVDGPVAFRQMSENGQVKEYKSTIEFHFNPSLIGLKFVGEVDYQTKYKAIDVFAEFDCPLFDVATNTRFDKDDGTSVGARPILEKIQRQAVDSAIESTAPELREGLEVLLRAHPDLADADPQAIASYLESLDEATREKLKSLVPNTDE